MPSVPQELENFLDSDDWEESKHILNENPSLLSDETESILEQMVLFYQIAVSQKGRTVDRVKEHLELIRKCRQTSIDVAFLNKQGFKEQSIETIIQTFFLSDSLEAMQNLVDTYPQLLDENVYGMIDSVVGFSLTHEGNIETENRRRLLRRCSDVGIKRAFLEFANGALHRPSDSDDVRGSFNGSNKREYLAQKLLFEGFQKEFPDIKPPISEPMAYQEVPGYSDGIVISNYEDRYGAWRLTHSDSLEDVYVQGLVDPYKFSENLFRTIKVAHKLVAGSFTNDAGSGLTPHNVTLDGEVKDLETFHSMELKDPPVIERHKIEDLRLGIEALKIFSIKLSLNTEKSNTILGQILARAYNIYTDNESEFTEWNQKEITNLLTELCEIPSVNLPSGDTLLKIARQFFTERKW